MQVVEMIFSPTGGTKRVADAIAERLARSFSTKPAKTLDVTAHKGAVSKPCEAGDIAVIASPVFGGRIPEPAAKRFAKAQGNGALAVVVAVYGNRAFEDALVELRDVAASAGFSVIAGIAAIAEHSIARQYASGRPDADDIARLRLFADEIAKKTAAPDFSAASAAEALSLPGNRPYKKAGGVKLVPKGTRACTACGTCAVECPTGAIDASAPRNANAKACISCMRCVHVCPHGARKANGLMTAIAGAALKGACSTRKEAELFA